MSVQSGLGGLPRYDGGDDAASNRRHRDGDQRDEQSLPAACFALTGSVRSARTRMRCLRRHACAFHEPSG